MRIKPKIKWMIDVLMTIALLCLMAYQVTGDQLHEWIGAAAVLLFVLHNVLNMNWYFTLWKGKYNILRIFRTVVNFGVLVTMICLGFSGFLLSRHVFAFLPINGPMATARRMHIAAAYWGFVLMSIHFGFHWSMILCIVKSRCIGKKYNTFCKWGARVVAFLVAGYGLYCFCKMNIISYMFLKVQFVFFDFEQPVYAVYAQNAAIMWFFVFAAYYAAKGIGIKKR